MILEEFMKGAVPSDRLIIEDSTGELYRGGLQSEFAAG